MEAFMKDANDDSWTTVSRNKKTSVPMGSGGYIPPHLRSKTPVAPVAKAIDMNSAEDFPTLGGSKTKKASAWGSKALFTEKIHELIAFEQRTEAEKMEAEEVARELEGYAVLSLKYDNERYIAFNDKMAAGERGLSRLAEAYDRLMYAHVIPKEVAMGEVNDIEDVEDVEDVREYEDE
jgi:hypothetical protein